MLRQSIKTKDNLLADVGNKLKKIASEMPVPHSLGKYFSTP